MPRRRRKRDELIDPAQVVRERDFQQTIMDYARLCGWRVYHFHDSRRQIRRPDGTTAWVGDSDAVGWPDLVLVRPPDVLIWELKSDDGDVTPEQRSTGDDLADCPGVEYAELRPADWNWVEVRLNQTRDKRTALTRIIGRLRLALSRLGV